jgi:hypothetical protein
MRAFLVVNCQSALVWLALRSCSQAAISSMRICLLGMKALRHDYHEIAVKLHRDRYDRALDEAIAQRATIPFTARAG